MNPWLEIPLEEYEGHMSLPSVAQAQYLTDVLERLIQSLSPHSVAVLGCSGGNGFEILSARGLQRAVGVDINPNYVAAARKRYEHSFPALELLCCDFLSQDCVFEPVDLVFAGLIFEYVDLSESLRRIKEFLLPGGFLGVVLQVPSPTLPHITSSPYRSLMNLEGFMRLIPPGDFKTQAKDSGFTICSEKHKTLRTEKSFYEAIFRKEKLARITN